jgi:hypothetical protein
VNAEKKLTLTWINGGYDGPPSRVCRVPAKASAPFGRRIRGCFLLIQINSEAQGAIHLVFDHRPTGREQHDKKCQASWIHRDCCALYGNSVVAPLLAGESAIRIL